MSDRIHQDLEGGVLTITNNDPATRNSISHDFHVGLRDILNAAAQDPALRAMVLTGAGGFFCSGGNVNGLQARCEASYEDRIANVSALHALIQSIRDCPKPIIAAIEGGAAGAGVALALATDMIFAARGAYFSVAYVKIGLTPDGGTTALLGSMIPRQLLTEMIMTGDRIEIERMHAHGVVNQLTAPGQSLKAAQNMAKRLAKGPAQALAQGKKLVQLAESSSFEEQLEAEARGLANALGAAEAREGIAAFLQKRPANFS